MGENEGRLVAVRPPHSLRLEIERRLISSRTHNVAIDRHEERRDEFRGHGVPVLKSVRGLEPVDASVSSRNETIETRRHVDRDSRGSVQHRHASLLRTKLNLGLPWAIVTWTFLNWHNMAIELRFPG